MTSWNKLPQTILVIFLILAGCVPMTAQSHSHGYFLMAPAVVSRDGTNHSAAHTAIGGERVFPVGLGLGAEVGALAINDAFGPAVVGTLFCEWLLSYTARLQFD